MLEGCPTKITIPPMVSEIIANGIEAVDGAIFTELDCCPDCGGDLRGHDYRRKKFATVIESGRPRNILVIVRRYRCISCGKLCYAHSPFYPDTRLGSPIVDFCVLNIRRYPYNHISRILEKMNIIVDRGTVRNYADLDPGLIPSVDVYGIMIPYSLLRLSERPFPGHQPRPVIRAENLIAGRFPSAHRTVPDRHRPSQKRNDRNQ